MVIILAQQLSQHLSTNVNFYPYCEKNNVPMLHNSRIKYFKLKHTVFKRHKYALFQNLQLTLTQILYRTKLFYNSPIWSKLLKQLFQQQPLHKSNEILSSNTKFNLLTRNVDKRAEQQRDCCASGCRHLSEPASSTVRV